jgi:hypothetical protein
MMKIVRTRQGRFDNYLKLQCNENCYLFWFYLFIKTTDNLNWHFCWNKFWIIDCTWIRIKFKLSVGNFESIILKGFWNKIHCHVVFRYSLGHLHILWISNNFKTNFCRLTIVEHPTCFVLIIGTLNSEVQ